MLKKFAVTNFRGFAERIEWDLSSPSNYEFNTHVVKNGIIKNGIIFGPNGSGKSNFSRAIFDIIYHLTQKMKAPDYYENFVYGGNEQLYVDFEYTFQFEAQTLMYAYSKNFRGKLMAESLIVDGSQVFERNEKSLYIDKKQFKINKDTENSLKKSANNVSIINYLLSSHPLPHGHYLLKLSDFVNSMLWFCSLPLNEYMGFKNDVNIIDEYIIKNNLVDDFAKFLQEVSGQQFEFVKPKATDKLLAFKIGGKGLNFDLIASTGTTSLRLLYYWLTQMHKASFVFIDEFDAFYHFKLAYEVCQRLFKLNCQVFTSSHNTYLMTNKLLRPDCNFILQNNKIKALQDCTDKELRIGHNIEKLFRGGAFEL